MTASRVQIFHRINPRRVARGASSVATVEGAVSRIDAICDAARRRVIAAVAAHAAQHPGSPWNGRPLVELERTVKALYAAWGVDIRDSFRESLPKTMREFAERAAEEMRTAGRYQHILGKPDEKRVQWHLNSAFDQVAMRTDKMAFEHIAQLRRISAEVIRTASITGQTRAEVSRQLMSRALTEIPGFQFIDRAGRRWKDKSYFEMLARTELMNAGRASYDDACAQNGQDVMVLSFSGESCKACTAYEGHLFSLTGKTPGLPTKDDLIEAGVFHPNCTHSYAAVSDYDRETRFDKDGKPLPKEEAEEKKAQRRKDNLDWIHNYDRKHQAEKAAEAAAEAKAAEAARAKAEAKAKAAAEEAARQAAKAAEEARKAEEQAKQAEEAARKAAEEAARQEKERTEREKQSKANTEANNFDFKKIIRQLPDYPAPPPIQYDDEAKAKIAERDRLLDFISKHSLQGSTKQTREAEEEVSRLNRWLDELNVIWNVNWLCKDKSLSPKQLSFTVSDNDLQNTARRACEYLRTIVSKDIITSDMVFQFVPVSNGETRAGFDESTNEIHINKNEKMSTIIHEMAHEIEAKNSFIRTVCINMLKMRASGCGIKTLEELTGIDYESYEFAFDDKFEKCDAYAGKIYIRGCDTPEKINEVIKTLKPSEILDKIDSTEILSMALENLVTNPSGFKKREPKLLSVTPQNW